MLENLPKCMLLFVCLVDKICLYTHTNESNAYEKGDTDCDGAFLWDDPRSSSHAQREACVRKEGTDGLQDVFKKNRRQRLD